MMLSLNTIRPSTYYVKHLLVCWSGWVVCFDCSLWYCTAAWTVRFFKRLFLALFPQEELATSSTPAPAEMSREWCFVHFWFPCHLWIIDMDSCSQHQHPQLASNKVRKRCHVCLWSALQDVTFALSQSIFSGTCWATRFSIAGGARVFGAVVWCRGYGLRVLWGLPGGGLPYPHGGRSWAQRSRLAKGRAGPMLMKNKSREQITSA